MEKGLLGMDSTMVEAMLPLHFNNKARDNVFTVQRTEAKKIKHSHSPRETSVYCLPTSSLYDICHMNFFLIYYCKYIYSKCIILYNINVSET